MKLCKTASGGLVRKFRNKSTSQGPQSCSLTRTLWKAHILNPKMEVWKMISLFNSGWFSGSSRLVFGSVNLLPFSSSCSCSGRSHAKGKIYLLFSISNSCSQAWKNKPNDVSERSESIQKSVKFYHKFSCQFPRTTDFLKPCGFVASNMKLLGCQSFWISIPLFKKKYSWTLGFIFPIFQRPEQVSCQFLSPEIWWNFW